MKFSEDDNNHESLSDLQWRQVSKLESELVTNENKKLASLTWKNNWGSLATAESPEGKWTLKRAGFLRPKVIIRDAVSGADIGIMTMDIRGGGILRLESGEVYHFKQSGDGLVVTEMNAEQREKILVMKLLNRPSFGALIRISKGVKIQRSDTFCLLSILSWYVAILSASYDADTGFTGVVATF